MKVQELWSELGLDAGEFRKELVVTRAEGREAADDISGGFDDVGVAADRMGARASTASVKMVDASRNAEAASIKHQRATLNLTAAQTKLKTVTESSTSTEEDRQRALLDVRSASLKVAEADNQLAASRQHLTEVTRESTSEQRIATDRLGLFRTQAQGASGDTDVFGRMLRMVKWPAFIQLAQYAAGALGATAGAAFSAGAALAPLSGLIAGYPILLSAAGQGLLSFKLATHGVGEALKASAKDAELFEKALAEVAPAARPFVRELVTMTPLLDQLRNTAAEGLFGEMTGDLDELRRLFPIVNQAVGDGANVFGRMAVDGIAMVTSGPWRRDLQSILATNVRLMESGSRATLDLADAGRHLFVAAEPLVLWMGRLAEGFADWAQEAAQSGRQSGDLARFFERTRDVAETLGSILSNVAHTLGGIAHVAAPIGEDMLDNLNDLTQRWEDFTGSARGQNEIAEYFRDARPVMSEIGALVADIAAGFVNLGRDSDLDDFIRKIRLDLLPVLFDTADTASGEFGPALVDLATAFMDLFSTLGTESGALTSFVKGMANMMEVVGDLLETVPGLGNLVVVLGTFSGALRTLGALGRLTGLAKIGSMLGLTGASATKGAAGLTGWRSAASAAGSVALPLAVGVFNVASAFKEATQWAEEMAAAPLKEFRNEVGDVARAIAEQQNSSEAGGSALDKFARSVGDVAGLLMGDPLESTKFDRLLETLRANADAADDLTGASGRLAQAEADVRLYTALAAKEIAQHGADSAEAKAAALGLTMAEEDLERAMKDQAIAAAEVQAKEESLLETRRRLMGLGDDAITAELDLRDAERSLADARRVLSRMEERGVTSGRKYILAQEDVTRAEVDVRRNRRDLIGVTKDLTDNIIGAVNVTKDGVKPFVKLAESFGLNTREIKELLRPGDKWHSTLERINRSGRLTKDQMRTLRGVLPGLRRAMADVVDVGRSLSGTMDSASDSIGDVIRASQGLPSRSISFLGVQVPRPSRSHRRQHGGPITEPVVGVGLRSGDNWTFGEDGKREHVVTEKQMAGVGGGGGPTYNFHRNVYGFDDFKAAVEQADYERREARRGL